MRRRTIETEKGRLNRPRPEYAVACAALRVSLLRRALGRGRRLCAILFWLVVVLLPPLTAGTPDRRPPSDYAIGADLSFLAQTEARGLVFKDNGRAK
ncbi:MAG TPA: hypothetical protein VEZ90_00730, partial [Blastocatellia bacterium]|nr:hypothetical protein [Blastocatellia bacterium]